MESQVFSADYIGRRSYTRCQFVMSKKKRKDDHPHLYPVVHGDGHNQGRGGLQLGMVAVRTVLGIDRRRSRGSTLRGSRPTFRREKRHPGRRRGIENKPAA